MPKDLFNKLNNLDYSDKSLEVVKTYLKTGETPSDYTYQQKYKFKKHWKDFVVKDSKLYFRPLALEAIPTTNVDKVLQAFYNDPKNGLNAGIRSFYDRICSRYVGITQSMTKDFLLKQTPYQLVKDPPKPVNRPLISKYCNNLWSMDLIDVNYYKGHNRKRAYILTVIDHFSKYVFAEGLIKKEAKSVVEALERIHQKQSKVYPVKLLSDNGTEFVNDIMKEFTKNNDIIHITTQTYSPTQNALIENFNGILRKMMRESFIRNDNFNWIDHLEEFCANRNGAKHSVTKHRPNELYTHTRTKVVDVPVDEEEVAPTQEEKIVNVKQRLENYAQKVLDKEIAQIYEVDDTVRIYLPSIDTKLRKLIKKGDGKKIIVKYSPEIYFIASVIKTRSDVFQKTKYTLKQANGDSVLNEKGKVLRLYATDLQKVDKDSKPIEIEPEKVNEELFDENDIEKVVEIVSKKKKNKKDVPVVENVELSKRVRKAPKHLDDYVTN